MEEVGKGLVSVFYSKDRLIIVLLSMEQGLSLVRVSSSHFTKKRWTQERYENGESIEFPRLTMQDGTINSASAYNSDFLAD